MNATRAARFINSPSPPAARIASTAKLPHLCYHDNKNMRRVFVETEAN
jgi:hypothetical protein